MDNSTTDVADRCLVRSDAQQIVCGQAPIEEGEEFRKFCKGMEPIIKALQKECAQIGMSLSGFAAAYERMNDGR